MTRSTARDRLAFLLAIHRADPTFWPGLARLRSPRRRPAVKAWLRKRKLGIPGLEWIEDEILSARAPPRSMRRYPETWIPGTSEAIPTHDQVLTLSWEPADSGEGRAAFLARARAALDGYTATVDAWAKEQGVVPVAERETGQVEIGLARWDILASYVIRGQTHAQIAIDFDLTRQAVTKQIRALFLRLGVKATGILRLGCPQEQRRPLPSPQDSPGIAPAIVR